MRCEPSVRRGENEHAAKSAYGDVKGGNRKESAFLSLRTRIPH
jgi:hypothetical protein